MRKQVIQINQQGEVVALWPSTRSAWHLSSGVSNVLLGINNTAMGYKWEYYKGTPIKFPNIPNIKYITYNVKLGMFIARRENYNIRIRLKHPIELENLPVVEPFKPNTRTPYAKGDLSSVKCPKKRRYLERQRARGRAYYYRNKDVKPQETKVLEEAPVWRPQMSLEFWATDPGVETRIRAKEKRQKEKEL